jgi:hypothetical protein
MLEGRQRPYSCGEYPVRQLECNCGSFQDGNLRHRDTALNDEAGGTITTNDQRRKISLKLTMASYLKHNM